MTNFANPVADALEAHELYWADTGGNLSFPVDPYQMAKRMGVRVYSEVLPPDRSGYFEGAGTKNPFIVVNNMDSLTRKRFTVAHELGHFFKAKKAKFIGAASTYDRDDLAKQGTDSDEIYANKFAAALLMPRSEVVKFSDMGMSAHDLANRFDVSRQSMDWRLENLGLKV